MLGVSTTHAQTIINVGGVGVIADQALATAKVPATANWTAAGGNGNTFSSLISPTVAVANNGAVSLTFTHRYNFEVDGSGNWDGGAVFVSVNGRVFTKVPLASFTTNGYSGTALASVWPLGEEIFAGQSTDWGVPTLITSVADLGLLSATDTVAVEFRGGWDGNTFPAAPNWEIGTVQIADTGGPLLNVDFLADGSSAFTASTTGTGSSPWQYIKPISRFELNADTLEADSYTAATPASVIDLNGANISVVKLSGTFVASSVFTLFDLSDGSTLTGTLGSITLPAGTWDTSNLTTNGTITLLVPVLPASQCGVLNLAANGGINPNTGLAWAVGDKYRLAFNTSGTTVTTSNDPEFYNDFATTQAWTVPALQCTYWRAMVTVNLDPTTTQALSPKREVKTNTGTTDLTGGSTQGGAGGPVYVVNGTTCIARNNADIWNTWSNPFENSVGVPNALGTGNNTTRVAGVFYSPYLKQNGTLVGVNVATGCNDAGNHVNALGNTTDNTTVNNGQSNANRADRVWNQFTQNTTTALSLYVISAPLTIVDANETVRPTLISFVDDRSGADLALGTGSIIYTVTFSETIDASTITIADFENAGTATVTIDRIRGTTNPAVFTVTVTPTTAGTVLLQTVAGAVIEDPVGNTLDTTAAIADDTIINVVIDSTPPTLTSIADNVSGGPINAFTGVTYTVTFDEAIIAGTVNIADFGNGGTAPIIVNSVVPTGNPAVYTVAVTTTGPGTLTLEVISGGTISDLSSNSLVTTSALPDDTTITVNPDPMPTLVSIVDNQAGGPVFAAQSFTYFVTFSQVINPASVDVSDFENGGSPACTVNAVARTSNLGVFAVHVTPGGAGTLTLQIAAGAVITNVNGTGVDTTSALADDTTITVDAGAGPARGTITLDGTATAFANSTSLLVSLNASGADKLVVVVTGENGNPGDLNGNSSAVTYDGVPLTKVIDRNPIGGTPFDQTYNDIWYLDNPATSTGAIVATVNSRGSVTAFALSGTAPGVGQTAISPQASKSVVLSTGFENSIVIASHGMGGDGNSANVTAVNAVLPLTERSATGQVSLWDGHVTATALVPVQGTATYAFTGGSTVGSHTIAAEFLAAVVPTNTFANWIATFPGAAGDTTFAGDPDCDGVGSGLENFFGTNPGASSPGLIAGVVNTGAGTFTFTHPQNATPAVDVSAPAYTWSTDLNTFTADGVANGGTTVTFSAMTDTPVVGTTTVTATVTGTAINQLFVRVNVTQIP